MRDVLRKWTTDDLEFLVETLIPERKDPEHILGLLRDDEKLLDAMLQDERLFAQLMADEEIFLTVSPRFFFKVLLLRARRDLETESYTVERRQLQNVVLFDTDRVADLLSDSCACDYLAGLLASFTRIQSVTIPVRIRPRIWRRIRINDLDVDSLVRYAQLLEGEQRFGIYQRIADACLFLTGIFPEYIEARQRYPQSGQPRPRLRSSLLHSLEDYESYGRAFYRMAASYATARVQGLHEVLTLLSEQFVLAEKPLVFVAERYLSLRKHHLYEL